MLEAEACWKLNQNHLDGGGGRGVRGKGVSLVSSVVKGRDCDEDNI